jgi:hypothetical protein
MSEQDFQRRSRSIAEAVRRLHGTLDQFEARLDRLEVLRAAVQTTSEALTPRNEPRRGSPPDDAAGAA